MNFFSNSNILREQTTTTCSFQQNQQKLSLSLLSKVEPKFSLSFQVSARCKFTRRIAQLRHNSILIFANNASKIKPDLSNITNIITLQPCDQVSIQSTTITVTTYCGSSNNFILPSFSSATLVYQSISATLAALRESDNYEENEESSNYMVKRIPKDDAYFSNHHLKQVISERLIMQQLNSLNSPFVSRLVRAYESDDALNMVLEKGELGNLKDVVLSVRKAKLKAKRGDKNKAQKVKSSVLPEDSIKSLFSELVLAIESIHSIGVLNRNITPSNIHLTSNAHIKVCDFSLSKQIPNVSNDTEDDRSSFESIGSASSSSSSSDTPKLARTNSFTGKRMFMSPEHLNMAFQSSAQSEQDVPLSYGMPNDIWSMGITLYIMITGRHPFVSSKSKSKPHDESNNDLQIFHRIMNETLSIPSYISEELKELLIGLLTKDENKRMSIDQIKNCKFLEDIDWEEVRSNAVDNARNDVVLSFLSSYNIRGVNSSTELYTSGNSSSNSNSSGEEDNSNNGEIIKANRYVSECSMNKFLTRKKSLLSMTKPVTSLKLFTCPESAITMSRQDIKIVNLDNRNQAAMGTSEIKLVGFEYTM